MRYLFFILLLTSCQTTEGAPYHRNKAPWSGLYYTVCKPANNSKLRPVIFPADIKNVPDLIVGKASAKYVYIPRTVSPDSTVTPFDMVEKIFDGDMVKSPNYFLREQYIGFLNEEDIWVNEKGIPVTDKSHFLKKQGEHTKPVQTVVSNKTIDISDASLKRTHERTISVIKKAPPCTFHIDMGHNTQIETKTHYNFGANNFYICGIENGYKRSTRVNMVRTTVQKVASRADGGGSYFKFLDKSFQYYPSNILVPDTVFTNKNGNDKCNWKPLREESVSTILMGFDGFTLTQE